MDTSERVSINRWGRQHSKLHSKNCIGLVLTGRGFRRSGDAGWAAPPPSTAICWHQTADQWLFLQMQNRRRPGLVPLFLRAHSPVTSRNDATSQEMHDAYVCACVRACACIFCVCGDWGGGDKTSSCTAKHWSLPPNNILERCCTAKRRSSPPHNCLINRHCSVKCRSSRARLSPRRRGVLSPPAAANSSSHPLKIQCLSVFVRDNRQRSAAAMCTSAKSLCVHVYVCVVCDGWVHACVRKCVRVSVEGESSKN